MFQIEIDGARAKLFVDAMRELPRDLQREIADAVKKGATAVAQTARQLLRKKKGPPASRPGDPPALDTGVLARSIRTRKARRDGSAYRIFAAQPYALFLEKGTETGGVRRTPRKRERIAMGIARRTVRFGGVERTKPRPFLTTALAERQADTTDFIAEAVARALDLAGKRAQ